MDKVTANKNGGDGFLSAWGGTGVGDVTNPMGANWIAIVLGLGFVLSFGYWTTNFAEVQRALSAKNMSAARRTPIIAAYPKLFIPVLTIIPGLIALIEFPKLGAESGDFQYNNAIPLLMDKYLPNGVLGHRGDRPCSRPSWPAWPPTCRASTPCSPTTSGRTTSRRTGRTTTTCGSAASSPCVGVVIGIGTAFIAAGYSNIMHYIQALFSIFNAPLFATFIIGMFWKRMTSAAGIAGPDRGHRRGGVHLRHVRERCRQLRLRRAAAVHLRVGPVGQLLGRGRGLRRRRRGQRRRDASCTAPKTEEELKGLVYGSEVDYGEITRRRQGVVAVARSCSAPARSRCLPPSTSPSSDRRDDERRQRHERARRPAPPRRDCSTSAASSAACSCSTA